MEQKKYKISLTLSVCESLHNCIVTLMMKEVSGDDDKMHMAILAEIKDRLFIKMNNIQKVYAISFTPAQAFALRILAIDYQMPKTTQLGNKLHQMANEIHQFYQ